ncbi:MAG TPA: family 16 glycoside hydrolase [Bryobacteraceae bacterium]|nr:family 16 glycoside hydrolase [Bryobacteraceae bacterium]
MRFRLAGVWIAALGLAAAQDFQLQDGDRVVFFGDSITDQRLYTTFTETFAVTRFPKRNITFIHSGWGGDRVTGGAGGGIDERLTRDVLAYKPSVVTIMLGMNDGRVRPFNDQIFDKYSSGYKNIIKQLKESGGIRITAIQPSPYDDVTRAPGFPGGYNGVLLRYADFVKDLGAKENLTVADLNRPVTAMLAKAKAADATNATKIIPDRVHPGPAGHLIMAEGLLKAWNAPATVSAVTIDAKARRVTKYENAAVVNAGFGAGVAWTQTDDALPMPIDMTDEVMALAVHSSGFVDALNRQIVKVDGLAAGPYTLRIDGSEITTRSAAEWAAGVNIALLRTPMWEQATRVHALTIKHTGVHQARWRTLQVPLQNDVKDTMAEALAALDKVEAELVARQRELAQPTPHRFELVPGGSAFQSVFNGSDLSGWHISQENHHGKTNAWTVDQRAITGTQDRPGHGGILLTDKKYKNFEISLEINPDYGCDSGLFLRATEKGEAYQVLLDYLDGGAVGGVYGERLKDVQTYLPVWQEWYKRGNWNHLRARIEGDTPHIQVWLNGIKITDWKDTANHLPGGATDGMVAVQVHAGNRWVPGGKHRFRNIAIRELP